MMNKIIFLLLVIGLLFTTVAISGCTTPNTITNPDQAAGAITNISGDVENVASALNDISNKLG
jgi:hypothetical protein